MFTHTCAHILLLFPSYLLLAKVGFWLDFVGDFLWESTWLKCLLALNTFPSNLPGWQLF